MKRIFAGAALAVVIGVTAQSAAVAQTILTIDRLVSHVTTVPVIKGDQVNLFVRERVDRKLMKQGSGKPFERKVVLMVHGGFSPSTLAFDTPYRDYSWMEYLAKQGFDVFTMDMTGYGRSTRPAPMEDPCNILPARPVSRTASR